MQYDHKYELQIIEVYDFSNRPLTLLLYQLYFYTAPAHAALIWVNETGHYPMDSRSKSLTVRLLLRVTS